MTGSIRVGVGGWTFEPWRGLFYPKGLAQKRELAFASRALTTIEINGTYYSTFKPQSWRDWRDQTPDDFVFSVKASRYATNRKVLGEAGPSITRFLEQGLTELKDKLGPIVWQFMPTKKFDSDDFEAFLALLPKSQDGIRLRHAVEVRHPSFATAAFQRLATKAGVAVVYGRGDDYPLIEHKSGGFTYARYMTALDDLEAGYRPREFGEIAKQARSWSGDGDVFVYFISGAKVRNPAAAMALIAKLKA